MWGHDDSTGPWAGNGERIVVVLRPKTEGGLLWAFSCFSFLRFEPRPPNSSHHWRGAGDTECEWTLQSITPFHTTDKCGCTKRDNPYASLPSQQHRVYFVLRMCLVAKNDLRSLWHGPTRRVVIPLSTPPPSSVGDRSTPVTPPGREEYPKNIRTYVRAWFLSTD